MQLMKSPVQTALRIRRLVQRSLQALMLMASGVAAAQAQTLVPLDPYNYARTTSYTYYGSTDGAKNGLLATETIEPDIPGACVVASYDYDDQGNRKSVTNSNCAGASGRQLFASRASSSSYTGIAAQAITVQGSSTNVLVPDGLFASSATNALGHVQSQTWDPRFGQPLRQVDANNLATDWQRDDFGRKIVEKHPDGTRTVTWYCVIGAGLDTASNSVIGGVACPTPAAGEAPAGAATFTHTEQRDTGSGIGAKMSPFTRVYLDRLGREIRSVTESFDGASQPAARNGALVVRDIVYNAYGAKEIETQPYFLASGSSATAGSNDRGLTRTDYDVLGRPVRSYVVDAEGSETSVSFGAYGAQRAAVQNFAYAGLSVTVTNDKGYTRTEEKNPIGEVVRITDATGGQLVRQFDAFGNLAATKDALQNIVSLSFDVRGHKSRLNDPDAGIIDYCYDTLGQLKAQQNALMRGTAAAGQCPNNADSDITATVAAGWTTFAYDKLGRTTHRIDPEYESRWYFDAYFGGAACGQGKGKLCESRTSHGVNRKLVYDAVGRLANQRTDISSGPSFASALAYDAATGRLDSKTYPTGVQVLYRYTGRGRLDKLLLAPSATLTPLPATAGGSAGATVNLAASSLLWQAKVEDAQGRREQQDYGSGVTVRVSYDAASGHVSAATAGAGSGTGVLDHDYTWDSLGNLTGRNDANGDGASGAVTETFAYADGLNRLTGYAVAATNIPGLARTVTLDYNVLGLLLRKSDVGIYTYGAQGSGAVRPHAVRSIAGAVNASFDYDENGNLKTASSGKYRSLAYTSFNLPDSNSGAQGAGGAPKYMWSYDEEHTRFKEVHVEASGTRTTWYLHPDNAGGLAFESEVAADGKLSQRHYLSVGGESIGVLVSTPALPTLTATQTAPTVVGSVALAKLEYWHKDHLGSLAVTTDHVGTVTARYAYDPFGKRRLADGNYDAAGNLVVDWSAAVNKGTDRGFTGHEHLDDIGLVHMNGRIYDPLIGRFMSADPHVTRPDVLQNYDRYSYVLNNPLNATDPTGFDPWYKERDDTGVDPNYGKVGNSYFGSVTRYSSAAIQSGPIDLRATDSNSQSLSAAGVITRPDWEARASYESDEGVRDRQMDVVAGHGAGETRLGTDVALGIGNLGTPGYLGIAMVGPLGEPMPGNPMTGDVYKMVGATAAVGAGLVAAPVAGSYALGQVEYWGLRAITRAATAELAATPGVGSAYLTSKELASANGRLVAARFGQVIERMVAQRVQESWVMSRLVEYTSRPFVKVPDFVSKYGNRVYDVTTQGTKWGADHFQRGYEGALRLIEYSRPQGFRF